MTHNSHEDNHALRMLVRADRLGLASYGGSVGALHEFGRCLLAMASPQLQQVNDQIRALASKAADAGDEELPATNEQMARPAERDAPSEPVVANGVGAQWISAPGGAADRAVRYLVWPEMIHRWQSYAAVVPEGQQAVEDIGDFLREQIA